MINVQKIKANPAAIVGRIMLYALVIAGAIAFSVPFLWMVRTSIMPPWQVARFPPEWIPEELHWGNWTRPFELLDMGIYFRNTLVLTFLNMVGALSSLPIAYAFARLRFRGRDLLFMVLLSTMMLPGQVTLIPIYVLFSKFGWIDTYKPLTVPGFFGNPFNVFLLRQFFMTIPRELDDSAKIDGCGIMGIFWRIVVPLSGPALGIIMIMTFTGSWNDFFGPIIYLWNPDKFPMALGLWIFKQMLRQEMGPMMAGTIMALAPVLAVFFVAQKYFVQGIVITGVKG